MIPRTAFIFLICIYRMNCLFGSLRPLSLALLMLIAPALLRAQGGLEQAKADVAYLTSPELGGRGYSDGGDLKAASYIRDQFTKLGLEGLSEGYFQNFEVQMNALVGPPMLKVNGKALVLGKDYLPDEGSGTGDIDGTLKVVTVGSGLVVPEKGIDDYKGKTVKDAVVLLDLRVPDKVQKDKSIDPVLWGHDNRIAIAASRGARMVITLVDQLSYGEYGRVTVIPVFKVFRKTFPKNVKTISAYIATSIRPFITQNVVAKLRGTSYPDSMIILTAHYDHLGSLGDNVYFPGANDNASGVAMLLGMARYFKAHPLKYSIVFIAFSGEEMGLLGSHYFVGDPLVDLGKARFLLNMDMTASGKEGVMAVGGVDFPSEFALLKAVTDSLGVKDLRKRENAPNSDQFYFIRNGMRGFYIYPFTGLQPYHRVEDRPATLQWDVYTRLDAIFRGFLEKL
ncbi:MAG: family metallo-hydrolase [Chlorobi bacterium]|nr:family metallo-hydrolase [Chlorobiota bacterium]